MDLPENQLKAALVAGQVQTGIWVSSASSILAELAGSCGLDWCLIDTEHAAQDLSNVLKQLQALAVTGTPAVVRVPSVEDWMIKKVLDMGAMNVLVPMVHDAELALQMAKAMRYPPVGVRGMGASMTRAARFGAIPDYVHQANEQVCLMVQADSIAALENIDEIAAVPGVDGVFVGPADLSADMGYVGQLEHPEVEAAIAHIVARTKAVGKFAGVLTFNHAKIPMYRDMGVEFMGVGGDIATLAKALRELAVLARG